MRMFLFLIFSAASILWASEANQEVRTCRVTSHPDTGVEVKIINVGDQPESGLYVAVVLSAGNIRPRILGSYTVRPLAPNGAGITGYRGPHFLLKIDSWDHTISLKTSGPQAVAIVGKPPFSNCF